MSNEHSKSNIYGRWADWSNQSYPNAWCSSASYLKTDSPRSRCWNEHVRASSLEVIPGSTRNYTCTWDSKGRNTNTVQFWIRGSCGKAWLNLTREIWVAMGRGLPQGTRELGYLSANSCHWRRATSEDYEYLWQPGRALRQTAAGAYSWESGVGGRTNAERMCAGHQQYPYASWHVWLSLQRINVSPWRWL